MSLYAEYLKEKTNDHIIETEHGFATFRYVIERNAVYIIDLYIKPEYRKANIASSMADAICQEAREKDFTLLLGSVVPSNKNSTTSVKVLLAYGMELESASNDFVVFKKEL